MAIQTPKSSSQYQSEILTALQATGVRQTAVGGKARALADIIGDELGQLESRQFVAISQNLLPYATGTALDALGTIYGVPRIGQQDASSAATDGNFIFYVLSGTFGNINNGQNITVPAGTQIFTSAGLGGPIYTLDADVICLAATSQQSFSASSTSSGSAGNSPAGTFNATNFTNYTGNIYGSLLVTNNFGIIAGRDEEDDASYAYRINLKLQSSGGNGQGDVQAAILQIPGIQNVVFSPLAGTYEVYVYGISPIVPPSLLQLVQTAINENTAYPLTGLALTPALIGVSLNTTVQMVSRVSANDTTSILSNATSAAANYINNLAIGQELVINEIASVIISSDTRILDIGQPNAPINEIFIWRSRLDATRYSRFLIGDYPPALGERVIVETSISNPITLVAD